MIAATRWGTRWRGHWGWSPEAGLILGLAVSVASTVVLLRALMDFGVLDSVHGRVAVGWLVLQDLATVAILVLLPLIVGADTGGQSGGCRRVVAVAARGVRRAHAGRGHARGGLAASSRRPLKSRELFVLVALTVALGTALAAANGSACHSRSARSSPASSCRVAVQPPGGAECRRSARRSPLLFFVSVGMLVKPG